MSNEIIITDPLALQLLDAIENTPDELLFEKLRGMGVTLNGFMEFVKAASLQEDPLVLEILENFRAPVRKMEAVGYEDELNEPGENYVVRDAEVTYDPAVAEDWFREFKAADQRAFKRIYDVHVRGIYHFLQSIVKDENAADEATSKTFLKVWNNRGKIKNGDHLRYYLYATARTIAIDHLRQKKRQFWSIADQEGLPGAETDRIDAKIMQAELLSEIRNYIDRLPGKNKDILRMYFFEQKSTDEIAAMLDMTPQAVRNAKVRSLEKLRRWTLGTDLLLLGLVLYFSLEAEKQYVDHHAPPKIENFRFHLS